MFGREYGWARTVYARTAQYYTRNNSRGMPRPRQKLVVKSAVAPCSTSFVVQGMGTVDSERPSLHQRPLNGREMPKSEATGANIAGVLFVGTGSGRDENNINIVALAPMHANRSKPSGQECASSRVGAPTAAEGRPSRRNAQRNAL